MTHGLSYLTQVDRVFVMKDGRFSEQGTYEELLARDGDFAELLRAYTLDESDDEEVGMLFNSFAPGNTPLCV